MSHIFKAGAALVLVALVTGTMPSLSPHWRAVAADLHQAQPPGQGEGGRLCAASRQERLIGRA